MLAREPGTAVHVVMDNYGTHKRPTVREWFVRHPGFAPHFTPIRASWLNQVERYFAAITRGHLRRGSFRSVETLDRGAEDYLNIHNERLRPFVWTKRVELILDKAKRICAHLDPTGN